jgi:hypothetical protein
MSSDTAPVSHVGGPPTYTPIAPDLSLSTLFGTKERGKALLEFLEVT